MHFHILRLFVIGIIIYLFIQFNVWDFAVKKYDEIHSNAVRDMHNLQMEYQHHY